MPGPEDLVSILLPTYNHENYIDSCLDSLRNQTYRRVELIVLDDGSTDSTADRVETFLSTCSDRFERIEFIRKANEGVVRTLNQGFDLVHGTYTYMIASDDQAHPEAVARLIEPMQNPQCAMVVGDSLFIDAQGQEALWTGHCDPKRYEAVPRWSQFYRQARPDVPFTSDAFGSYASLIRGNYLPCGQLLRTSVILELGKYPPQVGLEDWYLALQIARKYQIVYVDHVLYRYRWHGSNASTLRRKALVRNSMRVLHGELAFCLRHRHLCRWLNSYARMLLALLRSK